MADIWMNVDAALAEVPVNVLPLLDDTDFKTIEDAVAYDAAGMDLRWNFVTTAGAFTSTAVTPTTAGDYDWAHQGDGMYSIEIPASGGASINNDTEGFGWFTGKVTGVLPFRGPIIGFRSSALNNSLINGSDRQEVDVKELNGSTTAAIRIALSAAQIIPFTVDDTVAPTTTQFEAADVTEATADHYKDRVVLWSTGALAGQVTEITAYSLVSGRGRFTVVAMTEAPADGDTGVLI